jgi:hypothetical protein
VVELHLMQDSSVTQTVCHECLAKMLQVTSNQTIVDASQLVYRSDAVVDEGAIELPWSAMRRSQRARCTRGTRWEEELEPLRSGVGV